MDIAVIGAGGDIGRQIATRLVADRLLAATDRLQLVEAPESRGERLVRGLRSDLADAFGETLPQIDVAVSPEDLAADLVIMAAGLTVPCDPRDLRSRAELAEANAPLFRAYAEALGRHGLGTEIVIIVSNPVELGVEIFARHVDRQSVIGMGAFLDTIRFRNEIAHDLSVRRQKVRGLVVGEHGPNMVPLWSTVSVQGVDRGTARARIDALAAAPPADVGAELRELAERVAAGGIEAAYEHVDGLPIPARLVLRPYITQFTGAKTPLGTGEIVIRLVRTVLSGSDTLTACQMRLEGDFLGLTGTIGVPVVMSNAGVRPFAEASLTAAEEARLRESFAATQAFLSGYVTS